VGKYSSGLVIWIRPFQESKRSDEMARDKLRMPTSLLIAATLLAWSVCPPPIQHSHQGGYDLSHQHGCADDKDHAVAACVDSHWMAEARGAIGDEASHVHFAWFGLRLTFPESDSPANKGESYDAVRLLFVSAGRGSVAQVNSAATFDTWAVPLLLNVSAANMAAGCPMAFRSLPPVTPHSLCDRARHERSGVQLS